MLLKLVCQYQSHSSVPNKTRPIGVVRSRLHVFYFDVLFPAIFYPERTQRLLLLDGYDLGSQKRDDKKLKFLIML